MKKTKEPIQFEYNNESYKIYKYTSGVVYIKKEIGGTWDFISAKEIIRRKLAEIDSTLYAYEETKKSKYSRTHTKRETKQLIEESLDDEEYLDMKQLWECTSDEDVKASHMKYAI